MHSYAAECVLIASRVELVRGEITAPTDCDVSLPSNVLHVHLPTYECELLAVRVPDYSRAPNLRRACWDWLLDAADVLRDRRAVIIGDLNTDPRYPRSRCGDRFLKVGGAGMAAGAGYRDELLDTSGPRRPDRPCVDCTEHRCAQRGLLRDRGIGSRAGRPRCQRPIRSCRSCGGSTHRSGILTRAIGRIAAPSETTGVLPEFEQLGKRTPPRGLVLRVMATPTQRQATRRSGRAGIRFLNAWSGSAALGLRRKCDAPAGRVAGHKSGAVANAARCRTVIGPEAFIRAIHLGRSRIAVTDRRIEGQQKDPIRILRFPREQGRVTTRHHPESPLRRELQAGSWTVNETK